MIDNPVSALSRTQPTASATALDLRAGDWDPAVARSAAAAGATTSQDRAFISLQNAYRPHGGLSRLDGFRAGMGVGSSLPGRDVEDLFVAGELFGFEWYGAIWIPMFQFALPGPTVATGPQSVVAELGRSFDGWALASWFVQPNDWLANHSPIECLDLRLPEVMAAARADRFVTTG